MTNRDQPPTLPVAVQLAPALLERIQATAGLEEEVRRAIAAEVSALLEALGLPGVPAVAFSPLEHDDDRQQYLRLVLDGVSCRYPDRLLARVLSYVTHTPLQQANFRAILDWLEAPAGEGQRDHLVSFLAHSCAAILGRDPSCLLAPALFAAYLDALPENSLSALPRETLFDVLRQLLGMRLALRDSALIADLLGNSAAEDSSPAAITEALISALRPAIVTLYLPPEDLQRLQKVETEESLFTLVRDGLFYELGMRYPGFRLVPDPGLPAHSFALQINDVRGLPWAGLQPGQILANESAGSLRLMGLDAAESLNPANDHEAAIVAIEHQEHLDETGLTTWDPLGYLVLCFSRELRQASATLLDRDVVAGLLYQLGEIFPALVDALYQQVDLDFVTRVLRGLLAEQVSIRNLREIAESILSFDTVVVNSRELIVFDDRLPLAVVVDAPTDAGMMTAFIRTQMKLALSHQFTRGQSTLLVYLLAPEIEERVAEGGELEPEEADRLLAAVRVEMGDASPTASQPVILTDVSVRARVRRLLAAEFPQLPVVAYQELSPAMNIQPIARIEAL